MTNDTGTGTVSINAEGAYVHSFGYLPNKTVYVKAFDGLVGSIDMRPELKAACDKGMAQMKALSVAGMGAGTAGSALIPVSIDPRIVDRTRKFTPWTELIQRVTNMGVTADYNYISAKGAAHTYVEDAPLNEQTDTEARGSVAIKYLYSKGRVTGVAQAAMPSYIVQGLQTSGTGTDTASFGSPTAPNAKQYEVLKKAQSLKELEENLIWNGNATTSAISGNANGSEFSGIVTQQSTTNVKDLSAVAMTWDDIETATAYAYDDSGRLNVGACDSSTLKDIRKIMIDSFRLTPESMKGTAGFGVPAPVVIETMMGPVPIIPSQYLSTTTGAKQLWFLDTEYIEMRVLQDMTYEDLAKSNDSQPFMLKMYEALVMKATQFNAFVDNIA